MNKDLQRQAIAEACGWKKEYAFVSQEFGTMGEEVQAWISPSGETSVCRIPDYLLDLNAMHEAEKTLTPKQSEEYVSIMDDVLGIPSAFYGTARRAYLVMHANALQRSEAFLKTIGKWVDTP